MTDLKPSRPFPIWHPFTQHAIQPEMVKVERGEGAYLYTFEGRRIFDGIASWWVVTHGHRHPRIIQAIKDQADKLDQVIFAGFTHEPAEKLAENLLSAAPRFPGQALLEHVFYSDSGSTAVEVALKMALGFWRHRGARRQRIVTLQHSYHGDTIGTMSVGERGVLNAAYEPLLFDVASIPFPHSGAEQTCLDALEAACAAGDVAAFIVEPLALGAGGMLFYPPWVLKEMRAICTRHDVLLILDEVMTGWGRTGSLFACEQAGAAPDILCTSKGLTGGSIPLAATLCTAEIFNAHYSPDRTRTFYHSSSYTANPMACAAALANLLIWEEEPVAERVDALAAMQAERLKPFEADERFVNVRRCGTIAALDVRTDGPGYLADIGPRLYEFFAGRDQLIRPLGAVLYLMPPYCATEADLDAAYAAIAESPEVL